MEIVQATVQGCYFSVKENRSKILDRVRGSLTQLEKETPEKQERRHLQRVNDLDRLRSANLQLEQWDLVLEFIDDNLYQDKKSLKEAGLWTGGHHNH
jgi:type VI protein secretion system component VasK